MILDDDNNWVNIEMPRKLMKHSSCKDERYTYSYYRNFENFILVHTQFADEFKANYSKLSNFEVYDYFTKQLGQVFKIVPFLSN